MSPIEHAEMALCDARAALRKILAIDPEQLYEPSRTILALRILQGEIERELGEAIADMKRLVERLEELR